MHDYLRSDQRQYPCLAGLPWSDRDATVCLPGKPILSLIRLSFRPDVDLTDENHVTFSLWQKSLAFISTVLGFQHLYWAPMHNEPRGVIVLIQWQNGDAWREFQASFGFGLVLPLLREKPLLNRCLQLTLPPTFTAGSNHFLEMVNLSLHSGFDTKCDTAEAQDKIETEWTNTSQHITDTNASASATAPRLLCSVGGWVERDLPSESPNFMGLFLWQTSSSVDLINEPPISRPSWPGPNAQTIEMISFLTSHLRQPGPIHASTRPSESLQPFSGTVLAAQITAPQYRLYKGFNYFTGWDTWGTQSLDEVKSGRRLCPGPAGYWCPMGAMTEHCFPSVGNVWTREAFPTSMIDVVWLQVDETHPSVFQTLRGLRLAIYNNLGYPALRWGRDISTPVSRVGSSRIGLLIDWESSRTNSALSQLDLLIQEAVATAAGVIQPLSAARYCARLPMTRSCRLELLSITIPNDECHKRLLWHAYYRYRYSMLSPFSGRASIYVRPPPDVAVHHCYQGFHEDETTRFEVPLSDVGSGQNVIKFSASSTWLSPEARAEWYADFAHQAAHQYERLGYIIDWFQTLAVSAECAFLDLEPMDPEFTAHRNFGRYSAERAGAARDGAQLPFHCF
ncbi:hypothetical protein BP00DRAFT_335497 [Aspergillus indologenus CBS 114.80]|uniref:Uncharacterized protein n=1 Tax=Aspergillus indologenus CBS 114.80 TaxID=1450541 RepID=A0A2V5IFW6_9EURO|nr:hypothetical protein BP00DRAFT_335497 [Aspergillus indologenus CBS 114.80]